MKKSLPLAAFLVFFAMVFPASAYVVSNVELASVSLTGSAGSGTSESGEFSSDNRYLVFDSNVSNLVSDDANNDYDVFLRDLTLNTTTKISMGGGHETPVGSSTLPRMSDDGRYIVYQSTASNVVMGDTNVKQDIFVYDRTTDTTTMVSRMSGAAGGMGGSDSYYPSISDDGSLVTFDSASIFEPADMFLGNIDIFLRNTTTNTTILLSQGSTGFGNSGSYNADISGDGAYVAFDSDASNFDATDTNGMTDIFMKKPTAGGSLWRISKTSSGAQTNGSSYTPSISKHGEYIAYMTMASNISADDTNGTYDIALYDYINDTTKLISRVNGTGAVGNSGSIYPHVSEDGSVVTFLSNASNLVSGDTNGKIDAFVYDVATQKLSRISGNESGTEGNDDARYVRPSADGSMAVFNSKANNLVSADSSGSDTDVYAATLEADNTNLTLTALSYDQANNELDYTIKNNGNVNIPSGSEVNSAITLTAPNATATTLLAFSSATATDFFQTGADHSFTYSLNSVSLAEGTTTIELCVEGDDNFTESNTADNCRETSITVSASGDSSTTDNTTTDTSGNTDTTLADAPDTDLTCDNPFIDTVGHWAEKTICLIAELGTVSGKSEGIFDPDNSVTRAELLKMVLLNSGTMVPASMDESPFSDVTSTDWYYNYVMEGSSLGVIEGYSDGTFRPNNPVNRAEALAMILRMAEVADQTSASGTSFSDLASTDWFYDEVGLGIDDGLVEGYSDGTFKPGNFITRAEAATIIRRAWYVWYQL